MLIDGPSLSNLCDYSFGDQSGSFGNVPGHFMKQYYHQRKNI